MEGSQKIKNITTIWPSDSTPEYLSSPNEDSNLKSYMHPNCIAAFQVGLVVRRNPLASAADVKRKGFDPWVRKSPWRRAGQSTPVFLPGESCGQRSPVAVKNGIQQTSMHGSKLNVHQQTNGKELIHTRGRVHTHSHTHTYHTMEYYSHRNEWKFVICNNLDGLGSYYAKQNKSDWESLNTVHHLGNLKK